MNTNQQSTQTASTAAVVDRNQIKTQSKLNDIADM